MNIIKLTALVILFFFLFTQCGHNNKMRKQAGGAIKGLKDYYQNYFRIGVAVTPGNLSGNEASLVLREFNSLTSENAMKMGPIHPKENEYSWRDADSIVNFAQHHGLKVRGHNLCWHEQTPGWLFKDDEGKLVTKDVLLKRLKNHITTVVNRYKGKIYAWDVVNEAIDDDSTKFLRNSMWYQVCGEDYIVKAFEYAHEADPEAILFYNDYNTERPEKRERVYKLLKQLVDAKVPINAVGLQGHWSIYEPTEKELTETIEKFSSLGLKIQITELDISVYPWEKNRREKQATDIDSYTSELEKKQTDQYKRVFKIFRDYKNVITGVTFWNISDKNTWLDKYPVPGRKNYPLLFDVNLHPKKAYWEVVKF
jgi:endo-1,4-beta-xylanase